MNDGASRGNHPDRFRVHGRGRRLALGGLNVTTLSIGSLRVSMAAQRNPIDDTYGVSLTANTPDVVSALADVRTLLSDLLGPIASVFANRFIPTKLPTEESGFRHGSTNVTIGPKCVTIQTVISSTQYARLSRYASDSATG